MSERLLSFPTQRPAAYWESLQPPPGLDEAKADMHGRQTSGTKIKHNSNAAFDKC